MATSILLINPNTSSSVTTMLHEYVENKLKAKDVSIISTTAQFGPAYISDEQGYVVASHAALECAKAASSPHGILVACFGDPGVFAIREACLLPTVGLAEASIMKAVAVGNFAIVTGGEKWKEMLRRLVLSIGYADKLTSIHTITLTGGEIHQNPAGAIDLLVAACNEAAAEGAEVVILGGAAMCGLTKQLMERVSVPIIDSVAAGAQVIYDLAKQHQNTL